MVSRVLQSLRLDRGDLIRRLLIGFSHSGSSYCMITEHTIQKQRLLFPKLLLSFLFELAFPVKHSKSRQVAGVTLTLVCHRKFRSFLPSSATWTWNQTFQPDNRTLVSTRRSRYLQSFPITIFESRVFSLVGDLCTSNHFDEVWCFCGQTTS